MFFKFFCEKKRYISVSEFRFYHMRKKKCNAQHQQQCGPLIPFFRCSPDELRFTLFLFLFIRISFFMLIGLLSTWTFVPKTCRNCIVLFIFRLLVMLNNNGQPMDCWRAQHSVRYKTWMKTTKYLLEYRSNVSIFVIFISYRYWWKSIHCIER